jgi:hypothetical protein
MYLETSNLIKYLVEGALVGLVAYSVPKNRLSVPEILLIALTSMLGLAILDTLQDRFSASGMNLDSVKLSALSLPNGKSKSKKPTPEEEEHKRKAKGRKESFYIAQEEEESETTGPSPPGSIRPPGGLRSEVMPLLRKNPKQLSMAQCKKVYNFLVANPMEYVNNDAIREIFKFCEQRLDAQKPPNGITEEDMKPILKKQHPQQEEARHMARPEERAPKKVTFNQRVKMQSPSGSIRSESLNDNSYRDIQRDHQNLQELLKQHRYQHQQLWQHDMNRLRMHQQDHLQLNRLGQQPLYSRQFERPFY